MTDEEKKLEALFKKADKSRLFEKAKSIYIRINSGLN